MTADLFHLGGMYVAAADADAAREFVEELCGLDPDDTVEPASLEILVECADVDAGEIPTPTSKRTARELIAEHLAGGGTLPHTVGFEPGL